MKMENSEFKYGPDCRLTKAERRKYERKFKNAIGKAKTIPANSAFNIAKIRLLKFGWEFDNNYGNTVDFGDRFTVTHSPIIMIENQLFDVKLIPHGDGVEISRIEVCDGFQNKGFGGKFLVSLLWFLIDLRIDDIFIIPQPVAFRGSNGNIAENQHELESFFTRRGFKEVEGGEYWKLDISEFKSRYSNRDVNLGLLKKLNPINAEDVKVSFRVFFEFEGDSQKNFRSTYNYPDYQKIRDIISTFHDCLPDCPDGMPDIKKVLSRLAKSQEIKQNDYLPLKEYFELLLTEYICETNYKKILDGLAAVFVGFLFIYLKGIENGINDFKLNFQPDGALRIYYNSPNVLNN